jgi:hypothetical protein
MFLSVSVEWQIAILAEIPGGGFALGSRSTRGRIVAEFLSQRLKVEEEVACATDSE